MLHVKTPNGCRWTWNCNGNTPGTFSSCLQSVCIKAAVTLQVIPRGKDPVAISARTVAQCGRSCQQPEDVSLTPHPDLICTCPGASLHHPGSSTFLSKPGLALAAAPHRLHLHPQRSLLPCVDIPVLKGMNLGTVTHHYLQEATTPSKT